MRFNIDNYKGKYVMHCETEDEAITFCNYLDSIGKRWTSGSRYTEYTCHYINRENTVYYFNADEYGSLLGAEEDNYTILEFSDFDWSKGFTKADLKTGDVVLRRCGDTEIVNGELGMFICRSGGWNDLDDLNNDLTHRFDKDFDIIEIRRPKEKHECCFVAFTYKRGTLVYERKEPEEMTLEQVCKLLGKEIKIIK